MKNETQAMIEVVQDLTIVGAILAVALISAMVTPPLFLLIAGLVGVIIHAVYALYQLKLGSIQDQIAQDRLDLG